MPLLPHHNKHQWVKSLLWFGFTLAVFSILVRLSLWQYDRGQQKEQRLARIAKLNQHAPLSLQQLMTLPKSENLNDYPLVVSGKFDNEVLFLLDNQVNKGALGYRVLQLLQTDEHNVLINLGFVPGSINRDELPNIKALNGEHQFSGHVRLIDTGLMLQAQEFNQLTDVNWPLRVQQIELTKFSALLNKPLLPFVIYINEKEPLGYQKNWQAIVMPPAKHFGYCVQWAALAITWLLLMLWLKFSPHFKSNKKKSAKKAKHYNKNKEAIHYD